MSHCTLSDSLSLCLSHCATLSDSLSLCVSHCVTHCLRSLGVVRGLGVAIFLPEQMEWILENTSHSIAKRNNSLLAWAQSHQIQMQARAALDGRGNNNATAIVKAASVHNVTNHQVQLRWILQNGLPVCTNPLTDARTKEFFSTFDFSLSQAEMDAISLSNCNDQCDLTGECGDTCANLVHSFSCATDYCETCRWAGWCDKTCGVGTCAKP